MLDFKGGIMKERKQSVLIPNSARVIVKVQAMTVELDLVDQRYLIDKLSARLMEMEKANAVEFPTPKLGAS